jgi:DNA-directed RNA polymerase subunit beta
LLYSARVIPYRGSGWISKFDPRDVVYVRIDRRRKFHATVLLRALGMTSEDLLNYYYQKRYTFISTVATADSRVQCQSSARREGKRRMCAILKPSDIIVKEGQKVHPASAAAKWKRRGLKQVPIASGNSCGRVAAHDIVDPHGKEVLVDGITKSRRKKLDLIRDKGLHPDSTCCSSTNSSVGPYLRTRCCKTGSDRRKTRSSKSIGACAPVDPPTVESATNFLQQFVFQSRSL